MDLVSSMAAGGVDRPSNATANVIPQINSLGHCASYKYAIGKIDYRCFTETHAVSAEVVASPPLYGLHIFVGYLVPCTVIATGVC